MHPNTLLYLVSCLALAAGSDSQYNFATSDARHTVNNGGAPIASSQESSPISSSDIAYNEDQSLFSQTDTLRNHPEFHSLPAHRNSPPQQPEISFNNKDECNNEHIVRYWGTVQLPPLDQSQASLRPLRPVDSFSFYQPSPQEISIIKELRRFLAYNFAQFDFNRHLSDADLVRFIRARHGHWEDILKMLSIHCQWRIKYEVDIFDQSCDQYFRSCPIQQEIRWAGLSIDQIPVLVVYPKLHPKQIDENLYIRYLAWLMKEGKRLYGVGETKPLYLLVDLAAPRHLQGNSMDSILRMAKMSFMNKIAKSLQENYPEVLKTAYIAPVSTILSRLTPFMHFIDERSRSKVVLIDEKDTSWWKERFLPHQQISLEAQGLR